MRGKGGAQKVTDDMEKMRQRREDRKYRENKKGQGNKPQQEIGNIMDVEYEKMIRKKKMEIYENNEPNPHKSSEGSKIFVLVRKRPLSKKELANGEIDCISCLNPKLIIHECKMKIDGFTKYLEDHEFYFDNTFSENESTEDVYKYSVLPIIPLVLSQGIVTCFAYGQTGSGKTYTIKGIENYSIDSLYEQAKEVKGKKLVFFISFFEIYAGRLYDLLNNKNKLQVLDDKNGRVQIYGLVEVPAESPDMMRAIIEKGNSIRTTHNTVTNETSSRSHAICNIVIKEEGKAETYGKLSLVDLAGSERAQETQTNNRERRAEGAEINKSLLALKECIRALDARKGGNTDIHVPFRASKLTHVLRDSFVSKSNKSKIIMISCVSPSYCSSNHSINTLRYSDRLKEQTSSMSKQLALNYKNRYYEDNFKGGNDGLAQMQANHNKAVAEKNNKKNNFKPKKENKNIIENSNKNQEEKNYHKEKISKDFNNKTNPNQNAITDNQIGLHYLDNNTTGIEDNLESVFLDDMINEMQLDEGEPKRNDNLISKENNGNIQNKENNYLDEEPEHDSQKENDGLDDLEYLKKTVIQDGHFISDDFVRYQQLNDLIVEDEDKIVNAHMMVIKIGGKLLTEECELITKLKNKETGVQDDFDFQMQDYFEKLEQIVDKKLSLYSGLKSKLNVYKNHLKEEDEIRKRNPNILIDPADV